MGNLMIVLTGQNDRPSRTVWQSMLGETHMPATLVKMSESWAGFLASLFLLLGSNVLYMSTFISVTLKWGESAMPRRREMEGGN
jgi:hypothetical protein